MSSSNSSQHYQDLGKSEIYMEAFPEVRRKNWEEVSESPRPASYRTDNGEQLFINERSSPLQSDERELAPEDSVYRLLYSGQGISDSRLLAEAEEPEELVEYVEALFG